MTDLIAMPENYENIRTGIVELLKAARSAAARNVNSIMTATYWEIGRRIVTLEQGGEHRAEYGERVVEQLAQDLTRQYHKLEFFNHLSPHISLCLALVRLRSPAFTQESRGPEFYEAEALRSGWSVRQLDRQIGSQFYERIALSKNKAAMLEKAEIAEPDDAITPEEAIKDPFVLEFLDLKDEYSESDLEEALIEHLTDFLLELGDDFAFVGRQRRLRIDDSWFRIDLIFFHRRLRCLLLADLKIGKFSYSDAGQMHLYLNYAREHWTKPGENPPVGLILCAEKGAAEAHYALDNLPNKILAAEYQTVLPDEKLIANELEKSRRELEARKRVFNWQFINE